MSDIEAQKPEESVMTVEEARAEKRRAKWAATGACIGGVAVGIGAGVLVGYALDIDPLINALVGAAAGTAIGGPVVVMGLEWVEDADARLETAQSTPRPSLEPAT